jgi:hypothetical protein
MREFLDWRNQSPSVLRVFLCDLRASASNPTFALHGISPIFGGRIPFTVNVGFVEKPWVKT